MINSVVVVTKGILMTEWVVTGMKAFKIRRQSTKKNDNSSLSTNVCSKSEENAQKSHEKDRQQCSICREDIDGSFVFLNRHKITKKDLIYDYKFHNSCIINYMKNKADFLGFF